MAKTKTKKQLEQVIDRLIHALRAVVTDWEITRDVRPAIERAKHVLADVMAEKETKYGTPDGKADVR